jgi:hypothetical protein
VNAANIAVASLNALKNTTGKVYRNINEIAI